MVYLIESNLFGIIKTVYCYKSNHMAAFCDEIYGKYKIFGYIESNSQEEAIKKYQELLLKN